MPKEYRTVQEVAGPLMLVKRLRESNMTSSAKSSLKAARQEGAVCLRLTEQMLSFSCLRRPTA